MRQATRPVTVDIPVAYYDTFIDMFKGMGIKYADSQPRATKPKPAPDSKEYILDTIAEGFRELQLWKEGKLEFKPAEELLNEL